MTEQPTQLSRSTPPGFIYAAALAAGGASLGLVFTKISPAWGALLLFAACAWLPVSGWLLFRANAARRAQEATSAVLRADRQLDQFRIARRDTLTGLANRQAFLDTLAAQFTRSASFALLLVDLDAFDGVNANLGDATGDEVLLSFASRLAGACAERDHAARLDGDGFAMLLTQADDLDNLQVAAERVLGLLQAPNSAGGQLIDVGVSIGLAIAPVHGLTSETLLRAARASLGHAKRAGGGRVHVCGQQDAAEVMTRQHVRKELQRAIEAGQVIPYYQPIVSLPSGDITKFEVLARWKHPQLGVLLPEQFIPMADELALSGQISMSLLRQVALETQDWPGWCRFAINVSAGQVRELIGLLNAQPGAWQRRLDLSRLDVEISEAALMRDRPLVRELIDVLHEHGARAVLDDFGSGASNFFHLRDLPFDTIKIGKGFVQTLTRDPRAEACVMSMLWLGYGLGIDIVADGVETREVGDRLGEMGCHYAQGYLYARPGPASEAALLLGVSEYVPVAA